MINIFKKMRGKFSFSTRGLLLGIFLPLICLFIAINSYISYTLTINQLRDASIENITFVIAQSRNYLDGTLENIFNNFMELDFKNQSEIDFCSVAPNADSSYQKYLVELSNQIDTIYYSLYEQLNSAFVYTDINDTLLYKSMHVPTSYLVNKVNLNKYSGKNYVWSYLYPDEQPIITAGEKSSTLSILKVFNSKFQNSSGIIQFNLQPEYYINLLNNSDQLTDCKLIIMADNRIVGSDFEGSTALSSAVNKHFSENPNSLHGSFLFKQQQENSFLIAYDTSNISGWKIVALIPYKSLEKKATAITALSVRNLIVLLIISSLLISLVMGMITKPIVSLAKKVVGLEDKSLDISFSKNSILNEVNFLNHGINHLVTHVKKLLHDVQIEQEEKRKAEFAALTAQINPHFLYNTLFSIKQLCDLNRCDAAGNMVMALSNFYRMGIGNDGFYLKLKSEFELTKNYMEIFKQKYEETFSFAYSINLPIALEECMIVKMALQPIVENAIYHGLAGKNGDKNISIGTVLDNGTIVITICDNGLGIPPDKLSAIKRKIAEVLNSKQASNRKMDTDSRRTGIGLLNVHKRIIMYYGDAYGLDIESILGKGTSVIIRIPFIYPN